MLILFVLCLCLIYPYTVYPVVLWHLSRSKSVEADSSDADRLPSVAVVISVYNGEDYIGKKLDNLLSQNGFDQDCSIYVVSDGSTDETEEIVERYHHDQVYLIKTGGRVGKTRAENMALDRIETDIVLFTDASTIFEKNVLNNLRRCLAHPYVGCVSTVDKIYGDDPTLTGQEGLYVRYEMLLRKLESDLGILVGASGSGYACKRELAKNIPAQLTRDMFTPLFARQRGLLSLSDADSICYVKTQPNPANEYVRKVRTIIGGYDTLWEMKGLMNPLKYGLFAFALVSHKLLRWLGGVFLIGIVVTTAILGFEENNWLFKGVFVIEVLFLVLSISKYLGWSKINNRYLNSLYYFVLANVAALHALYNSLAGKSVVTWEPTKR